MTRKTWFMWQSAEEKRASRRENSEIYRQPPLSIHLGIEQYICVKKLPEAEIEPLNNP